MNIIKKISLNKDYIINFLLKLLFIFMPILIFTIMKLYIGFKLQNIIPVFSDESCWYNQVMSVVKYGRPLGYFGYNGSHAKLGTFGAWGPFIVYLMSIIPIIFVNIFKLNGYYSIVLGNIFWICFANFLFLKLTNPNKRKLIRLIFISLILYINWLYLLLSMSEILRYSLSIILAGMIIYCLNTSSKTKTYPIILYIITPIIIICFMSAYIMFSAIIPIWFYCIYKRNKITLSKHFLSYCFISLLMWIAITIGIFILNNIFSSPYVTNGYDNIICAFRDSFVSGIRCILKVFLINAKSVDIWTILESTNIDYGVFSFYVLFYYLVIGILILTIYNSIKTNNFIDIENSIISLYILLIFLIGFFILYTTNTWTFIRGINVAFTFAIYVMSITNENMIDFKKIFIYSLFVFIPVVLIWNSMFMSNRTNQDYIALLNNYKNILEKYITIEANTDPWNNTIALYGNAENILISAFPTGAGINYMINNDSNTNSKYIVSFSLDENLLNKFREKKYKKIYSDNYLTIFYTR